MATQEGSSPPGPPGDPASTALVAYSCLPSHPSADAPARPGLFLLAFFLLSSVWSWLHPTRSSRRGCVHPPSASPQSLSPLPESLPALSQTWSYGPPTIRPGVWRWGWDGGAFHFECDEPGSVILNLGLEPTQLSLWGEGRECARSCSKGRSL